MKHFKWHPAGCNVTRSSQSILSALQAQHTLPGWLMLLAPWPSRVHVGAAGSIIDGEYQSMKSQLSYERAWFCCCPSWAGTQRSPRCHTNVIMLRFASRTDASITVQGVSKSCMYASLLPSRQQGTANCFTAADLLQHSAQWHALRPLNWIKQTVLKLCGQLLCNQRNQRNQRHLSWSLLPATATFEPSCNSKAQLHLLRERHRLVSTTSSSSTTGGVTIADSFSALTLPQQQQDLLHQPWLESRRAGPSPTPASLLELTWPPC